MKKKLFYLSLLAMSLGLILFSSLSGVLGLEFSSAPDAMTTSSSEWKLLIDGAVYHPINLTFDELVAMPNSTVSAELHCFGQFITGGYWTGVRLELVLEKAGLDQQAASVNLYAQDGYTTPLTITEAMREDVIIAYKKDNESLPETLRLVIPWANGDRWISMITQITVSTFPVSIPESQFPTLPTPEPSPTPQQSLTPQPSPTPQPRNQSATPPVIPSSTPPAQQQNFLGSTLPAEYGYAIVAVIVVAIAATAFLVYFRKIRKTTGKVEAVKEGTNNKLNDPNSLTSG